MHLHCWSKSKCEHSTRSLVACRANAVSLLLKKQMPSFGFITSGGCGKCRIVAVQEANSIIWLSICIEAGLTAGEKANAIIRLDRLQRRANAVCSIIRLPRLSDRVSLLVKKQMRFFSLTVCGRTGQMQPCRFAAEVLCFTCRHDRVFCQLSCS